MGFHSLRPRLGCGESGLSLASPSSPQEESTTPSSTAPAVYWPGLRLSPEQGSQERNGALATCH